MESFLNNRFNTLLFFPFVLGGLTVFSFQPFNLVFINFIVLPLFFYLSVYIKKKSKSTYRKKPFLRNLFLIGFVFGLFVATYGMDGVYTLVKNLTGIAKDEIDTVIKEN